MAGPLSEPLNPTAIIKPQTPEDVTRVREESAAATGLRLPPTQFELDWYDRVGRARPTS